MSCCGSSTSLRSRMMSRAMLKSQVPTLHQGKMDCDCLGGKAPRTPAEDSCTPILSAASSFGI
ncbi:hypothetical protein AKJ16_DCAP24575 [Drosera capensis]